MKLKEVIVVEGKHDTQKLKSFFDVDTLETHGLGLTKKQLELIKKVNEERGVVLFLDPDAAGNKIRKKINDYIPNLKNAFIEKSKCKTSKKVGIEHANFKDLEESLSHLLTYCKQEEVSLSYEDYLSFGFQGEISSKQKRYDVGNLLFLGECNAKTLYKRMNMFQITKEELEKIIKELYE